MKQNSLLKKVLLNNLTIMIIPFFLVLFAICSFICHSYKEDETRSLTNLVNEYANDLSEEIDIALHRSNFIMKSNNILDGLSATYDNVSDVVHFTNDVDIFMNNLTNSESAQASIKIFTTNAALFETKYIDHMNNLPGISDIKTRFNNEHTDILWDEYISLDKDGNKYFTIYRKPPLKNDCLIVCYVTFPPLTDATDDIIVSHYNSVYDSSKYVTADVRKLFTAAIPYDYDKIHERYLEYILVFLLLSIAILLCMYFITYKVNKNILSEIDNVIARLAENDEQATNTKLTENPKDTVEISFIKSAINSLILKVEDRISSIYNIELEKRKAELNLLQSKLGPHILYNSLSVIKLNVLENKNENSLSLIDDLVNYYRAILNYGKEVISIEDEIKMTEKYVKIYERAHDKIYTLTVDVPDEIKSLKVLHLILQPFVENSIIHGLSGSRQNCHIHIKARKDGDKIIFDCLDNGYGISQDKLSELNTIDCSDSSYGIKNTLERLKLYYPDCGNIEYESTLDKGTKVTITLKYIK